jgi:ectoine hydroxylase-related dioxygenase (phytanoyl-CoA dioxygenase family)
MMDNGYKLIKNFLNDDALIELISILTPIHEKWCEENKEFYNKKAINSAYLTSSQKTSSEDRMSLFKIVTMSEIIYEMENIFTNEKGRFLNTQLFFNPVNKKQKNYWHRDIQYTNDPIDLQRNEVTKKVNNVVHFRIALKDEPGVELIPGSHARWDTEEEFDVRTQQNNRDSFNDLPNSNLIELNKGDLLIFSANMIHRGIYGKDRLAFDILFCENDPNILKYSKRNCFPTSEEMIKLNHSYIFQE